jgi:hypothetical protein
VTTWVSLLPLLFRAAAQDPDRELACEIDSLARPVFARSVPGELLRIPAARSLADYLAAAHRISSSGADARKVIGLASKKDGGLLLLTMLYNQTGGAEYRGALIEAVRNCKSSAELAELCESILLARDDSLVQAVCESIRAHGWKDGRAAAEDLAPWLLLEAWGYPQAWKLLQGVPDPCLRQEPRASVHRFVRGDLSALDKALEDATSGDRTLMNAVVRTRSPKLILKLILKTSSRRLEGAARNEPYILARVYLGFGGERDPLAELVRDLKDRPIKLSLEHLLNQRALPIAELPRALAAADAKTAPGLSEETRTELILMSLHWPEDARARRLVWSTPYESHRFLKRRGLPGILHPNPVSQLWKSAGEAWAELDSVPPFSLDTDELDLLARTLEKFGEMPEGLPPCAKKFVQETFELRMRRSLNGAPPEERGKEGFSSFLDLTRVLLDLSRSAQSDPWILARILERSEGLLGCEPFSKRLDRLGIDRQGYLEKLCCFAEAVGEFPIDPRQSTGLSLPPFSAKGLVYRKRGSAPFEPAQPYFASVLLHDLIVNESELPVDLTFSPRIREVFGKNRPGVEITLKLEPGAILTGFELRGRLVETLDLGRAVRDLAHPEAIARDRAADELRAWSAASVPFLREALWAGDPAIRLKARRILRELGR